MSDFMDKLQENATMNKRMPVIFENDSVQIQSDDNHTKVYLPQIPVRKHTPWMLMLLSALVVFSGSIGFIIQANQAMSLFLMISGAIAMLLTTITFGNDIREPRNTLTMRDDVDNETLLKVAQSHDVLGGALAHIYINGGEQAVKDALNDVDDSLEDSLNFWEE